MYGKRKSNTGLLFRAARRIYRFINIKPYRIIGDDGSKHSAVYVVHHQNCLGPLRFIAYSRKTPRVWVLYLFFDRKTATEQYINYTFSKRLGGKRWWSTPAARFSGWIVPKLLKSAGAVPVYRGDKRIKSTFSESAELLKSGESILIAPDIDYSNSSEDINDIYTGFLILGSLYASETGKRLPFLPVRCDKIEKSITIGEPVYVNAKDAESRRTAAEQIIEAIRR